MSSLTLAALAAPALRTYSLYFPEGPTYSTKGFACPLSSEPLAPTDIGWLTELNWRTVSADLNGWPTAVMALGLCAVLVLRGRWGVAAAWLTAALFVVIAGVFSIPYAVQVSLDDCTETIRFGGWDIVMYGPILHYVAGAVLVAFLALIRREEGARLQA
ncbi:hypothetical protein BKM31_42355 [[Actinomadura] parvosata subsp. kistnae]|uniref:Uncharacterized protein n=1 Tax=[Actinomadura] parvosata subsp. kistnae TaxID=1909395 RepID=A0A1V0AAJ8_9ACTN|nr:hypothetical protein [Nonomuraea sp. ATCC 55076]AQZ67217.1 hypothetical protein BKM31_42355 [Nonomuraea sp. ATCC 55076]